ncbi:hypothetical protein [Streptomyces sp. NPDC015130]|uniref:hypothetical protein n=1 Tax=Streptomyces sp. NPDC015130 TaxID=3364940 RepID=UPI00370173DF
MNLRRPSAPPILYGAYALAGLSLIWSGYAITDLIHSGWFGLSVALAGDLGWITVMWAEHKRLGGRYATVAGWVIALMVGALLVLHGVLAHDLGQAIAGPFVVLVGKTVAQFALLAMQDPAALTAEQEAEINDVIRDSEYKARMHAAQLDQFDREAEATIARIKAEARVTLVRDDEDFRIGMERLEKRAAIERNSRIAIGPITAEVVREQPAEPYRTAEHPEASARPEPAMNSTNTNCEQPSITKLAREQVANTPDNALAIRAVLALRPDANEQSVAATVRRVRKQSDARGGYR